ncbi:MAG: hypothetical protein ABFD12_05330, partial [Syntrophorhabdus sp.]
HLNKLKAKLSELDRQMIQKQQAANTCEAKWTQGQSLYNAGKHADALVLFKENVACAPGKTDRESYVRQLEDTLKKQAAAKQACVALRQTGDQLVQQKKYPDAIGKFRESLKCQPDPKLEEYVKQLEETVKKETAAKQACGALRQQGDGFVQQKKYADAVGKYRESLKCQPDPKLEAYIRQLEGEVKKQADAQAAQNRAKQLRTEGEQFQKQNKVRDAIAKYKESLKYVPDPALEAHINKLEAQAKKQDESGAAQARAKALRDEGAKFQTQKKISEAIGKYKESLTYVPDAQLEAHIKKLEASLASKPAISPPTAVSTSTGPAPAAWNGNWKSVAGPEGEVISFDLASAGNRISGNFNVIFPYKTSSGAQKMESLSGPLQGTLSGNKATGTFYEAGTPKNKGTFEFTMVSGHKEFSCTVRGEEGQSRTYTVKKTR